MSHAMMNVLSVLLAYLVAVSAVPTHFPHGKTVVYNYHANVQVGTIKPIPYASQFVVDGVINVKHDTTDATLNNAYQVVLTDVKCGLHNGQSMNVDEMGPLHPIVESAKILQDPFLIVYDENGKFQGVKLVQNESGWSKNIKQAIASMLQLDLPSIRIQIPVRPHSFQTTESTIHGLCDVAYTVQPADQALHQQTTDTFVVTKMHDPKMCSHFTQRNFDQFDHMKCNIESQDLFISPDAISASSRKVFEIENQGEAILIKKLVGIGSITYTPWQANSESHYVLANQTLTLQNIVPVTETHLPTINFQDLPIIRDVTYKQPQDNYALYADVDLTQGRHIVKLDVLIPKLKKMLGEAADYLEEKHLETKEPEWKHGQTINRMLRTMSYMDVGSLEHVYNAIQDVSTLRQATIRNIFLGMVPNVGTTASSLFVRNVIRKRKVSDMSAILMLSKLPMHVKIPSERLLIEMEDLIKFGDTVSAEVKKAGILCFSSLIRKTFMDDDSDVVKPLLARYLQHFLEHVKKEPTYQMKMTYLMAIKNVQVGNIHELLEPIIRGDVVISEKPQHLRAQAIWAIKDALVGKDHYAHDLLWPILSDMTLSLPLRVVCYDVLIRQSPNMGRLMNLHWLMTYEKNPQMYNYHITTLKGLARSVDPCKNAVQVSAKKLLHFTKFKPATTTMSSHYHVEYKDSIYEFGETVEASLIVDELTALPQAGYVEHETMVGNKRVKQMGIYFSSYGVQQLMNIVLKEVVGETIGTVTSESVMHILERAARDMPAPKDIHLDVCITMNGHVILVNHYNKDNWRTIFDQFVQWKQVISEANINWQHVTYDVLNEVQVPMDMGLPTLIGTKIPRLMSWKLTTAMPVAKQTIDLNVKSDFRTWRHGEHAMSVYNPIDDVWHAVRKVMAQDVIVPIDMYISYNHEAKSLKVTLPRLPLNQLSVGGMLTHAKNYVTVTEDEADVLKSSCSTCHHHEVVTMGAAHKRTHQNTFDSKDTGLQYTMAIFDCETGQTPVTHYKTIINILGEMYMKNLDKLSKIIVPVQHYLTLLQISPEAGSCGNLVKVEPSILYPTSKINMFMRMSIEELDHARKEMHYLANKKVNIRIASDTEAASSDVSVCSWDMNVNLDMSEGHVNNTFKLQATRTTPGEKKLKICIDAQKNYPVVEGDVLKVGRINEEVNTKMILSMGSSEDGQCVRDQMVVTMTTKGELTDEQKKELTNVDIHNQCLKVMQNPHFQALKGVIPKTWSCIHDAIAHSTIRKYTTNITHKKVPQSVVTQVIMITDFLRAGLLPYVNYTTNHVDPGNIKVVVDYPVNTYMMDMSVITPNCGYNFVQLPLGNPIWNIMMDNTHFSTLFLQNYLSGDKKVCTVYPQVLVTADDGAMPFIVPNEWTLLSGDYAVKTFAVFVKHENNAMVMKMYVGNQKVEVVVVDSTVKATVNGNVLDLPVVVPEDEPETYAMKIIKTQGHVIVQSKRVPLMIHYTQHSVTLLIDSTLQGRITGMCGHMDGTHKEKIPQIYKVSEL